MRKNVLLADLRILCVGMALFSAVAMGGQIAGDVDFSGTVDAVDVQLAINAALGITIDSDNDGLCDTAETAHGTDKSKADTDGDGMSDYQELVNGSNPTESDSWTGGTLPEPALPDLRIENTADYPITELYIVPTGTEKWGLDLLSGVSIQPQGTFDISDKLLGRYCIAVGINTADGVVYAYQYDLFLGERAATWEITPEHHESNTIIFYNEEAATVTALMIRQDRTPVFNNNELDFGPNLLSEPIEPGSSFTISDWPSGSFHLKCFYGSGSGSGSLRYILLTGGYTYSATNPVPDLIPPLTSNSFTLQNKGGYSIQKFFVSSETDVGLGPNILNEPLPPGESITVSGLDDGEYEFKLCYMHVTGEERCPSNSLLLQGNQSYDWWFYEGEELLGPRNSITIYSNIDTQLYQPIHRVTVEGEHYALSEQDLGGIPHGGSLFVGDLPDGSYKVLVTAIINISRESSKSWVSTVHVSGGQNFDVHFK